MRDNGEIAHLSIQEAKKAEKITLNAVVSQMNSRDPIWTRYSKSRAKKTSGADS